MRISQLPASSAPSCDLREPSSNAGIHFELLRAMQCGNATHSKEKSMICQAAFGHLLQRTWSHNTDLEGISFPRMLVLDVFVLCCSLVAFEYMHDESEIQAGQPSVFGIASQQPAGNKTIDAASKACPSVHQWKLMKYQHAANYGKAFGRYAWPPRGIQHFSYSFLRT